MLHYFRYYLTLFFITVSSLLYAQSFRFAQITDTHVGSETGAEDLRRTVADINSNPDIEFVIHSGDVTEFGADAEFLLAKQILDSLKVPYYITPGNHDANWSESGGNSFRKIFGAETFSFEHKGYVFVGTNSGPNMRMSPGQIPRENLVWMDSLFAENPGRKPLIYVNHYPQNSDLNNWYEALDRIKKRNIQFIMLGHGHVNKAFNFEGIPGIMGRSNLRAQEAVGGYNIINIHEGKATYSTRIPGVETQAPWTEVVLKDHHFEQENRDWPRPDYSLNSQQQQVELLWKFQDDSDLGAGLVAYKSSIITANTQGVVYALDAGSGKKLWTFKTGGKIYSTPAVWKNAVVLGSSDGFIYGLSAKDGHLMWKVKTQKAVLGSPVIEKGVAYIGGSDHCFRAIDVRSGKVLWIYEQVKGFMVSTPLLYNNILYFGAWGNTFYALSAKDGQPVWTWSNGYTNRMFSPASVVPVQANQRIFIVAPDRFMTALDADNGSVIWREKQEAYRVRESLGISYDHRLAYVKTMDGELLGISTDSSSMKVVWKSDLKLPYELAPSAIAATKDMVFVPSDKGLLSGVDAKSGLVQWQYKLSNALINPVTPLKGKRVVVSSMDGTIVCLKYL